jgi:hypothetical protein
MFLNFADRFKVDTIDIQEIPESVGKLPAFFSR